MKRRSLVVAAALALAGPVASARAAPDAGTAKEEQMNALTGVWIYASDPKGEIASDSLYDGSTMTFAPEGRYAFRLAGSTFALEGTYRAEGWSDAGGVVRTDYGQGRTNTLHVELRRDAAGAVTGFVVREGEKKTGARYYRKQ